MAGQFEQFKPEQNDAAIDYMRQIFGSIVDLVYQGNVNGGQPADSTIGAFMYVFGSGAFFLGMLFFVYSTAIGMIQSGEDGRFLGKKASQVMLPVRTFVGSAILFPAKNGFSLVQILVIWMALQGAGMGTKSFVAILNFFKETRMILQPVIPDAKPLVLAITRSELCKSAMNKYFTQTEDEARVSFQSRDITHSSNVGHNATTESATYNYNMQSANSSYNYNTTDPAAATSSVVTEHYREYSWRANGGDFNNDMICGGLEFRTSWGGIGTNKNLEGIKNPLYIAHAEGVNKVIERVRPLMDELVNQNKKPDPIFVQNAINDYISVMSKAAAQAVSETNDKAMTDFIQYAEDGGFLYAGTWIGHINRMNDAVQQTLNDLPATRSLPLSQKFDQTSLQTYNDYMVVLEQTTRSANESLSMAYQNDVGTAGGDDGVAAKLKELISSFTQGLTRWTIEAIAGDNLSHITQMRNFGDNLLTAAEAAALLLAGSAGLADSLTANVTVGAVFSVPAALQSLSGITTTTLMALFGFGLMLAVYIPMVPLISWIMACLNWLLLVAEAVIAAPLFAVAHLNPKGEEEIGSAGEGYRMLTSLVMRPSLMVISLVVSIILQNTIAGYINAVFMPYTQAMQSGSLFGLFKYLGAVAIYVSLQLSVVHSCNALMFLLPDRAMLWLGRSIAGLGGAERVESEVKGNMDRFSKGSHDIGLMGIAKGGEKGREQKTRQEIGGGGPGGAGNNNSQKSRADF